MRFRTLSGMLVLFVGLMGAGGCEKKGEEPKVEDEEPKAEGVLEISVEPDPVTITAGEGDYTTLVTARETGGAAVDLTKATVVITYLDSTHVMMGTMDLTATQMTWTATTPKDGGPAAPLLEQFWHLDAGESKEYELPLKIGTDITGPEDFPGIYFSVLYIQAALGAGQSGFMITLTYEATDANDHLLFDTFSLRIQIQVEGALEISVEPDPVMIASEAGEYTMHITARETGGVATDLTKATVVITYLDSTHVMLGAMDLTATQMTWTATTPEDGGPAAPLLEQFWHLDAGEVKEYELPLKIGTDITGPEDFPGIYFSVLYVQAALGAGKSGFMITLTYEATDANGHLLSGTFSLRIQIQT